MTTFKLQVQERVKYKHQASTDGSIIIIMGPKDVSKYERSSKSQHSIVIHVHSQIRLYRA